MKNTLLYCVATLSSVLAACTSEPAKETFTCETPGALTAVADITITARDAAIDARGGTFIAWTYDGDVPGPVVRMNVGDTKRIKLLNESPRPTSLHFHGVAYSSADDGSTGPAMVNPGCAHVYTVRAVTPGVWAYHSHRDPRTEMARGLHGAIVVPEPGEAPADREYVVFLAQLGLEEVAEGGEAGEGEEGGGAPPLFAMTINGRPDGNAEVIEWDAAAAKYVVRQGAKATAKVGELVRWRVVNASPDAAHTFHLHGHRWCAGGVLANAQGTCPAASPAVDDVDLQPAQGVSLQYREDNPGEWMYHCHVVDHVNDGMFALYDVSP